MSGPVDEKKGVCPGRSHKAEVFSCYSSPSPSASRTAATTLGVAS